MKGLALRQGEHQVGLDDVILSAFAGAIESNGLRGELDAVLGRLTGVETISDELKPDVKTITARLRGELAKASVHSLEPDLVILDEFQRFRHLIDPESGSAASELAHHLFNHRDAKVLLHSATPHKPYTTVAGDSEDDHYRDFMTTPGFLAGRDGDALARVSIS